MLNLFHKYSTPLDVSFHRPSSSCAHLKGFSPFLISFARTDITLLPTLLPYNFFALPIFFSRFVSVVMCFITLRMYSLLTGGTSMLPFASNTLSGLSVLNLHVRHGLPIKFSSS